MANPTNSTNTTVPIETYNTLKKIKEKTGMTFSEILDQLCELEFQNNYVQQTSSYELLYHDKVYPFEIIFKKNDFIINYITPSGKTSHINKWGLDKKVTAEFFEFINEECARCVFQNIPFGLMFRDFDIYKLG